jgi:hypothetical protein
MLKTAMPPTVYIQVIFEQKLNFYIGDTACILLLFDVIVKKIVDENNLSKFAKGF